MANGRRVLAVAALVVVGCTPTPEAGLGGPGLPVQRSGESYPGARRPVFATFEIAGNGCFELDIDGTNHFVIWPMGSSLDGPVQVRLPDGTVLASGDPIDGTGAFTRRAPLTADRNGYWATVIGFCAPDATEVVVLDSASRASE